MSPQADNAAWGLWRLPDDLAPGELKWVRNALALPRSWRGFVAEFPSREEASDACTPDHFIREIAE